MRLFLIIRSIGIFAAGCWNRKVTVQSVRHHQAEVNPNVARTDDSNRPCPGKQSYRGD
jgi:hypothetical protein